jgi:hypothetical protein
MKMTVRRLNSISTVFEKELNDILQVNYDNEFMKITFKVQWSFQILYLRLEALSFERHALDSIVYMYALKNYLQVKTEFFANAELPFPLKKINQTY